MYFRIYTRVRYQSFSNQSLQIKMLASRGETSASAHYGRTLTAAQLFFLPN